MTEFSQQNIFKNESFLHEESRLDEQDFLEMRKCGEIILLANTKFWFLCTFCDERYHSILVFQNHIKGVHFTDAGNTGKTHHQNPLDLHSNEELDEDGSFNDQVDDIEEMNCNEYKLNGDAEIKGHFKNEIQDLVIINQSPSYEIEEILPTQINTENNTKDCKIEENNQDYIPEEDLTKTNNLMNKDLISESIEDLVPASKNSTKKRGRNKKVYMCSYCQHIAHDKISLETHMQSNHDTCTQYQCEECGKCFKNRSNLRSHLVIHTGTRPYKCDFCDAGFSHSNSLKAHRYIHTGNRPHKCKECDKGFVSLGALKIHMREHTGETPYICKFCEKAFATQCSYKRHMISHSGHRAHKCKQCEKAFMHKETLMKHMASHSTETRFFCDACPKKFHCKKNLSQHKKLHMNTKQYICKVCNKHFAQNAGLYSHMKCHKNKE